MRVLTGFLTMVLTAAAFAQPAGGNTTCEKDVFIYFDVSGSMYMEREGASAAQLVAEAVSGLIGREGFAASGDRVRVTVFAERLAVLTDIPDAAAAAREIRTLADGTAVTARVLDVGDRNRTDLAAVLNDMRARSDEDRHQIFIIASDFAHDPQKSECSQWRGRITAFRSLAVDTHGDMAQSHRKLALLTATVKNDQCEGQEQEVATNVIAIFKEILDAKVVEITHSSNRIVNHLRREIAEPVIVHQAGPASSPNELLLKALNPNRFRVDVQKVTFQSQDGTTTAETEHKASLGCGEEAPIAVEIPEALRDRPTLKVALVTTTPPVEALEIPRQSVVITQPEVHVFDHFGDDTFAVEFVVEPFGAEEVTLAVTGIPGTKGEQIYKLPVRTKSRVALTARGNGRGDKSRITVALSSGRLYVRKPGEEAQRIVKIQAQAPQNATADDTPSVVRWGAIGTLAMMCLSLMRFVPGSPGTWYRRFNDGRTLLDFLRSLGLPMDLLGGTSFPTVIGWRCGTIAGSAGTETIILSLAAAGSAMFALRWFAILGLWRWLFERELVSTRKAVQRRRLLAVIIIAIAAGVGWWVYATLSGALVDSVLISPERDA